jgi:hypothetical protein
VTLLNHGELSTRLYVADISFGGQRGLPRYNDNPSSDYQVLMQRLVCSKSLPIDRGKHLQFVLANLRPAGLKDQTCLFSAVLLQSHVQTNQRMRFHSDI